MRPGLLYAVGAMRKISVAVLLFAAGLRAQTADVAYFRAVMLRANEVPAVNVIGQGSADLIAHVVRDSAGPIVSGTVEFIVHAHLRTASTPTGSHDDAPDATV